MRAELPVAGFADATVTARSRFTMRRLRSGMRTGLLYDASFSNYRCGHGMEFVIDNAIGAAMLFFGQMGIRFTHQDPIDCGLPSAFLWSGQTIR